MLGRYFRFSHADKGIIKARSHGLIFNLFTTKNRLLAVVI